MSNAIDFRSLLLNRRQTFALGGGLALGTLGSQGTRSANAQDEPELIDFSASVMAFLNANPDLQYQGQTGLGYYILDQRRAAGVNGSDVFTGLEDAWLGAGSANLIRPNQGTLHNLNWDLVIYSSVDSFVNNGAADTFLENCRNTVTPYNPTEITLPEGMAANDFAWLFSFPYANDPTISVNRIVSGYRLGPDAVVTIFDSYGEPLPENVTNTWLEEMVNTFRGNRNREGLIPGPILVGNPAQVDWLYRMYDGEFITHFGDDQPDQAERAALFETFYAGSTNAANFHWSGAQVLDGAPQEVFWALLDFPDETEAQRFFSEYPDRIAPIDESNNLTRSPLSTSMEFLADELFGAHHIRIDGGQDQSIVGQGLLVQSGNYVWETSLLIPEPVATSDVTIPGDEEASAVATEMFRGFIQGIIDGKIGPLPLHLGVQSISE